MNRQEFRELAEARLLDARALFDAGRYDAAYYLAGYAVECSLKACISRLTREFDFPPKAKKVTDYYSHDLEKLLGIAGLAEFKVALEQDGILARNWNFVTRWSEESRL